MAQVNIKEPNDVRNMLGSFIESNKNTLERLGWRIQISATRDRVGMERLKREFEFQYNNIPVMFVHDRPYYKLRVGAFETELEGQRLLSIIRNDYPTAYLVRDDKINPAEFIY